MKRLIKWLFLLVFLFGVLLGMVTVNSFEDSAMVSQSSDISANDLKQVKRFIRLNNPAKFSSGQIAKTQISQQDLNLFLHYISQKAPDPLKNRMNAATILGEKQAYLQITLKIPENPAGAYLNILAELQSNEVGNMQSGLKLSSLRVGRMNIPLFLAGPLTNAVHGLLQKKIIEYQLLSQSVKSVQFKQKSLTINYLWDQKTAESIKSKLSSRIIDNKLKQALIAQSNKLAILSYQLAVKPGLNELLKPMFKLAEKRSNKNNPVIENKAVFITLGAYALKRNISKFFEKKYQQPIKYKQIILKNRHDLSKHLLISAAITSLSDSGLAESIGFEKEISDSQDGSGFSFADLAADQAGIRLAEFSMASEQQARNLQLKMATVEFEADYMPAIDDLPEGLTQTDLNSEYVRTTTYNKIQKLIDQRIENLSVYK
jgi:hypothetical protein